jgi:hypothetical protein
MTGAGGLDVMAKETLLLLPEIKPLSSMTVLTELYLTLKRSA